MTTTDPTTNPTTNPTFTDEELLEYINSSPELSLLPLPKSFREKYNIKVPQPDNFKESLEANHAIKSKFASKGLIILNTPDDYVFPEIVKDDVPLEIMSEEVVVVP